MNVFLDDVDRRVFLRILRETSELYSLHHYTYSLMTNHFHLISNPEYASSLSPTMREVLGSYASYFNSRHGMKGHLWQGRFFSTVMDEEHFWIGLRYVERNPVRAGIVRSAEEYAWSAAAAHCGLRKDPLLIPLPKMPSYIKSWSSWIEVEDLHQHLKAIRTCTRTGHPCGGDLFVEGLEQLLGISLKRRPRGRPKSAIIAPSGILPFSH